MITLPTRTDEPLTLALEVHGEHDEVQIERAEMLIAKTRRLLPRHAEIGWEFGEENLFGFCGDEVSLRLLHALGVKLGWVPDLDTFEELAGLE